MKLGIMQPYFFPYAGYFDLILRTDRWIVFDTPQYIRHGWVNRNRILHPKSGWQYVSVPVKKHSREIAIKDVRIDNARQWKRRIFGQLEHYKKRARYYESTMNFLAECLDGEFVRLSELNVRCLRLVCAYLGIPFRFNMYSAMNLPVEPAKDSGDWALNICKAMGASGYLNPPGGARLFDADRFAAEGIELEIQRFNNLAYDTRQYEFEAGLSIIDILMWITPEEIRDSLMKANNDHASSR